MEDSEVNIAEMTGYRLGAWLSDTPRSIKGQGYLWPNKEMLKLLTDLGPVGG